MKIHALGAIQMSKTNDDMARWYRDRQAEIDKALADLKRHGETCAICIRISDAFCKECKRLKDRLWQARYYDD